MRYVAPLAAALLLAIPAASAQDRLPPNCMPPKCTVTVFAPENCGAGISVSKDPIVVPLRRPTDIEWVLPADSPWSFDGATGIVVYMAQTKEITPYRDPQRSNEKKFTVRNEASVAATYKYNINLVSKSGKCNLDPTIMTN